MEDLLRGALETGKRGVNVLIHGSPGTGKTEFCRVLAKRMDVELFSIGEADAVGGEPTRSERLGELRLAQSLLGRDGGSPLLFDEMDDLLSEDSMSFPLFSIPRRRRPKGAMSKVFMNRLLEDNATPTLWTTNEVHDMNAAILRRMIYALEMRLPPPRIRARIWARQLAQHDIEATDTDTRTLAHEFDAPPGVAAGATAAADLGDGGFELVRRSVRSLSRVLGCERAEGLQSTDFDPALVEADLDLTDLADRLQRSGERRFSVCLQGPPGTGKSAYARWLADRLGLEVMHRRASDLLSMWVGATEQNIARAFAEARDTEAFLIFDEADSLLADRRGAHRSWEVSQVNEMLTWMESHPLPFRSASLTFESAATRDELLDRLGEWATANDSYGILYLWFPCTEGTRLMLNDRGEEGATVSFDDIASPIEHGAYTSENCVLHLGPCWPQSATEEDETRFIERTGFSAISGYAADVEWSDSLAFDLLYLERIAESACEGLLALM